MAARASGKPFPVRNSPRPAAAIPRRVRSPGSARCAPSPLFEQIAIDLHQWYPDGVDEQTMDRAIEADASVTLAWQHGRAYVVESAASERRLEREPPFFRLEFAAYLLDMVALEEAGMVPSDGAAELIVQVSDKTLNPTMSARDTPAIGRYNRKLNGNRSPSPEIRIPSWAFRMRNFDSAFLGTQMDRLVRQHPWEQKAPVLFGRYTAYPAADPRLVRRNSSEMTRNTREYFVQHAAEWLPHGAFDLNLSSANRRPGSSTKKTEVNSAYMKVEMVAWPRSKYLLCLAGITWSGTCEMLMTMGSVPFVEQSGYATYFSSDLVPYEHFVPVWQDYPSDVTDAFAWAQSDDARARRVAERARAFAARHLSLTARQCYWRELISRLTREQPYFALAVVSGRRRLIPAREYLYGRVVKMMQQANSMIETQGGVGRCLMRCRDAQPGECTSPCMY